MAETALEQVLFDLRNQAATLYPEQGEFRNIRVVGHTPKNDHFIYDASVDFERGSERVAIKLYRSGKFAGNAKTVARQENANLQYLNQTFTGRKRLEGLPRLLGDYSELGAVVTEKVAGLRLFSDADGKMNLGLDDVGGALLVVSQFTLYGDTAKGRRPSFIDAAPPAVAAPTVEPQAIRSSGWLARIPPPLPLPRPAQRCSAALLMTSTHCVIPLPRRTV